VSLAATNIAIGLLMARRRISAVEALEVLEVDALDAGVSIGRLAAIHVAVHEESHHPESGPSTVASST